MKSVENNGFPKIDNGYIIYHFRSPSQGANPVVHFIWKGNEDDENSADENTKIVTTYEVNKKLLGK